MSCHRCFIYLGDLARYKGLYGEGDSKNREHAAASSGNPHHKVIFPCLFHVMFLVGTTMSYSLSNGINLMSQLLL